MWDMDQHAYSDLPPLYWEIVELLEHRILDDLLWKWLLEPR
jgi:hypothetical protein